MSSAVDESTPLRASVLVNDEVYPPAYYNAFREIFGGILQILIIFPLLLVLCIVISPLLIYWVIQILCQFDPRGVKNGQKPKNAPRVDEEPDANTHIGTVKILFIIPDGGYDPAEVSIMYNTLKSYKKYDNDDVRIIFATPSGAIDTMNLGQRISTTKDKSKKSKNRGNGDDEESGTYSADSTAVEVFAYGCDPLFKSPFGFGIFYAPYVDTYYRDMLQSVDWYNSRWKNNPDNYQKEVISFEEIETEDIAEMYDGIYIAGGHHWNFNKLFKDRMLHYKLSKLWQLSLDNESGMNDPIQFAAIGRGVAVLGQALYTHSLQLEEDTSMMIEDSKSNTNIEVSIHSSRGDNDGNGDDDEDEVVDKEVAIRQASRYDSDTDSDDEFPSMLPSATTSRETLIVPTSPVGGSIPEFGKPKQKSKKELKQEQKIKKKAKEKLMKQQLKRQNSPLYSGGGATSPRSPRGGGGGQSAQEAKKKSQRSILYHVSVTTLPEWCEFLGNLVAMIQYGQIFSASNPHMASCAEMVETAVGDDAPDIALAAEKKFYHKGPQNWLVWFFQSAYEYCTNGDFRLTYVVEDSHIVTGRWFIDANLVAKRFMAKMTED